MKIAICDDELTDCELLYSYCKQYNSKLDITLFFSASDLYDAFQKTFFDLIFLDIEMQRPNGYEIAEKLAASASKPIIIFITKTLNYAVRGYGIAFRYLPKPIKYDLFSKTLEEVSPYLVPQKIVIPYQNEEKVLAITDILYFEVYVHEVTFHLTSAKPIKANGTLAYYIDMIRSPHFIQIHKSYCINLNYVDRAGKQHIFLTNGDKLPLGRIYKEHFHQRLRIFLKGQL